MTTDPTDLPPELLQRAERDDPQALHALGHELLRRGRPDEALPRWLRAATLGHTDAKVDAARILIYLQATPADIAQGVELLRRADAEGAPAAAYLLALLALGGRALERDFFQINTWMLRSAKAGHAPALRAVALFFGRSPNPAGQQMAVQLLQQAAEKGDAVSAALLAERLAFGDGVARDPEQARSLRAQLSGIGFPALAEVPPASTRAGDPAEALTLSFERVVEALPAAQTLSERPWVRVFDDLLTPEECRFVIAMGAPHLRESRVFDPNSDQTSRREVRTSNDASFDWMLEDFYLRLLQLRMARAAGAELVQGENLIVLRYQPGEQYHPHRDYLPASAIAQRRPQAGQRCTSVCCYLNPVEAGGETEFPLRQVKVSPAPGRAVVFDNLHADGSPDPDSLHAGLPVERGEKWLATLWLRQGPFRDF